MDHTCERLAAEPSTAPTSGTHTPLVSKELWDRAQAVLDHRFAGKRRKSKHDFAFSGLISCGHCGCALVGEIKKARYVYHCTGYKGKCPEPYTREEVLEGKFGTHLQRLSFDKEMVEWVRDALRESHDEERRFHEEAIARFHAEYGRLQSRIDKMYVDKLDGRISTEFFDQKSAEWRAEQDRALRGVEKHQSANQNYLEEGVQLLELARRAHVLFAEQPAAEKRRLLSLIVSNCSWKDGVLSVTFREPFDSLAITAAAHENNKAAEGSSDDLLENWLRRLVSVRTAQPFGRTRSLSRSWLGSAATQTVRPVPGHFSVSGVRLRLRAKVGADLRGRARGEAFARFNSAGAFERLPFP